MKSGLILNDRRAAGTSGVLSYGFIFLPYHCCLLTACAHRSFDTTVHPHALPASQLQAFDEQSIKDDVAKLMKAVTEGDVSGLV